MEYKKVKKSALATNTSIIYCSGAGGDNKAIQSQMSMSLFRNEKTCT